MSEAVVAHDERPDSEPLATLSPRELEVLEMAARGLTNAQIANGLYVTVHAVKFHLAGIYRKLGVGNRTEAAVVYLRAGGPIVQPAPEQLF